MSIEDGIHADRARRRRDREGGQTLIAFVMTMTVVFVIGAIVVDVGLWLSQRRHAQSAADLSALAAAAMLDDSDAETIAKGLEFAERNGFDDADGDIDVVVTPNYNGNPDRVEVTISQDSPALFASLFGLVSLDIGARAVATLQQAPPVPGFPAIWANSEDCGPPAPLVISGSENLAIGVVHSNGGILLNGSDNTFEGDFTYHNDCLLDESGSGNTFSPDPAQTDTLPIPINFAYDDFNCDFEFFVDTDLAAHPELWVGDDPSSGMLRELVICSTQDLQLSGDGISGTVTLVAGDELKISGSNFDLTALQGFVLFYSSAGHDAAIDVSASGGSFVGFIHAPTPGALIKIQGSANLSIHGSVIGDQVQLSVSDFSINASGEPPVPPQPPTIWLVE